LGAHLKNQIMNSDVATLLSNARANVVSPRGRECAQHHPPFARMKADAPPTRSSREQLLIPASHVKIKRKHTFQANSNRVTWAKGRAASWMRL
jgi:hypothetical protein